MRKKYKTEAIVIRGRDLSEKDQIVTFISPFEGKFDAVCKGSKKLTSQSAGKLQPFNRLNLFIASGKTLDTVVQSDLLDGFSQIRKSLEKTSTALYLLDLINRYVEKYEKNPGLYNLLKTSLTMMDKGVAPPLAGLIFEVKFISVMGYQPDLTECVSCREPGDHHYIDYHLGGILCDKCRKQSSENNGKKITPGTLHSLRFLLKSGHNIASRLKIPAVIAEELKFIIDRYINYNIPGTPVDKYCYERLNGKC